MAISLSSLEEHLWTIRAQAAAATIQFACAAEAFRKIFREQRKWQRLDQWLNPTSLDTAGHTVGSGRRGCRSSIDLFGPPQTNTRAERAIGWLAYGLEAASDASGFTSGC